MGNRLSSVTCSPSCSSMYSLIISSVMVPECADLASDPELPHCVGQQFVEGVIAVLKRTYGRQ